MSGKFILLAALAAAVLASCQLSNPGPGGGGSDDVLALNGDWNGVVTYARTGTVEFDSGSSIVTVNESCSYTRDCLCSATYTGGRITSGPDDLTVGTYSVNNTEEVYNGETLWSRTVDVAPSGPLLELLRGAFVVMDFSADRYDITFEFECLHGKSTVTYYDDPPETDEYAEQSFQTPEITLAGLPLSADRTSIAGSRTLKDADGFDVSVSWSFTRK